MQAGTSSASNHGFFSGTYLAKGAPNEHHRPRTPGSRKTIAVEPLSSDQAMDPDTSDDTRQAPLAEGRRPAGLVTTENHIYSAERVRDGANSIYDGANVEVRQSHPGKNRRARPVNITVVLPSNERLLITVSSESGNTELSALPAGSRNKERDPTV